jgi:hypothetical protein
MNTNKGYVIKLINGKLWKPLGAENASVFSTAENARQTIAGFSGHGALKDPLVMKITANWNPDAKFHAEGYWLIPAACTREG